MTEAWLVVLPFASSSWRSHLSSMDGMADYLGSFPPICSLAHQHIICSLSLRNQERNEKLAKRSTMDEVLVIARHRHLETLEWDLLLNNSNISVYLWCDCCLYYLTITGHLIGQIKSKTGGNGSESKILPYLMWWPIGWAHSKHFFRFWNTCPTTNHLFSFYCNWRSIILWIFSRKGITFFWMMATSSRRIHCGGT